VNLGKEQASRGLEAKSEAPPGRNAGTRGPGREGSYLMERERKERKRRKRREKKRKKRKKERLLEAITTFNNL
jgi:hypothetical protein